MSKKIKQLEIAALTRTFQGVRDMVFLSVSGVDAVTENKTRLDLRKKGIRLQMVKNSLVSRVLKEQGISIRDRLKKDGDKVSKVKGTYWDGPTTIAWGGSSISDLSKELEAAFTKNDKTKTKVKFKGAVSDGQEITFEAAKKMLTRAEALGRVIGLALAPAARLLSQITGPASMVASQVKTISEKKEEEKKDEAPPAPAEAAAPTA
jgi:large subunit ribosomal protein L10